MNCKTTCPDWERRILAKESLIALPPLFPAEADSALDVFKALRIVDQQGGPPFGAIGRQWVFDFVGAIFGAYDPEEGRRLISEFFLFVSKKNSKALALDTPIPTPSGWKTIGDIIPGDVVFGVDGEPCNVLAVSGVFNNHDCYRLAFSNGETVVADAGHLWETMVLQDRPGVGQGNDRKSKRNRIRTTREIAETLLRNDGARNHSIIMPEALNLPEAPLLVPPYTLGAWLGDGHSESARMTCADEEIMQNIVADGFKLGVRYQTKSKAWSQTIGVLDRSICYRGHPSSDRGANNRCLACERETDRARRNGGAPSAPIRFSLNTVLQKAGLIHNKHIPDAYFRASFKQRLALLQGLMDTDGTINKNGRCLVYTGKNKRLVQGVSELLATFGIKNSLIGREVSCNGVSAGIAYSVQFMAFRDKLPVFRLKRKLGRMLFSGKTKNKARSKTVHIVSAEKVATVPVKCIAVDAADRQFLFGKSMLPTHNSTLAAGIMLTALIRNWRDSAEFLILAPTVEIANNSFYPARDMVKADEELSALLHIQEHYRQITHRGNGATLKIVAADNETVGGKKATGILVDELWLFGKRQNAENMLREACGGLASRPEGFVIYLSTQSDEAPAGVFKQKLDYARGVRDGRIDDNRFLPVLYEFPESILKDKAHLDPKNFYITNPNLGASVDEEFLKREYKKAEEAGEESMQGFLAKHLNVEMGLALRSKRWSGADFWQQAAGAVTLDDILTRCEVVVVGIDGGGLDDLLGLAVLGREIDTGSWLLWNRAWASAIALERRKSEVSKYRDFEKDGDLVIVDEVGQDIEQIGEIIERIESAGLLDRIGVDPAGIGDIVDEIVLVRNIEHDRVVGIPQGWRLTGAIKTTERKLAEGALAHGGRPMMAWCVGNAMVEPRGNAILITKQASGTGKIDPLMATFNAVALMAMNPDSRIKRSAYAGMTTEQIKERMAL